VAHGIGCQKICRQSSFACQASSLDITADYMARNASALARLEAEGAVEVLPFPESVPAGLRSLTLEVVEELAGRDPVAAKIWNSYREFLRRSRPWQNLTELSILTTGSL
jgi:TRAP-type mannitol/chloroaromatic compound transport system substrate-binding protein